MEEAVRDEWAKSGGTYASPEIWITLVRQGRRVSVNTIAKLWPSSGSSPEGPPRTRAGPDEGRPGPGSGP
ncbi:transposase [Streptomyces coelicoflavus]|uniref:transposase n=1 Tax=Streptomyces coelicoflavus TaxID=285562 RepID=UPI003B982D8F